MHKAKNNTIDYLKNDRGLTLIEVMMTLLIFGTVLVVVNQVFFTSQSLYSKTSQRAGQQMDSRAGMGVLVNEVRMAGADPAEAGVGGLLSASADTLHVQFDLDGDGAITTAEPSEDVTYFFNSSLQALFRDPGTGAQLMMPNVTEMTLTYYDENDQELGPLPLSVTQIDSVRSVGVVIKTGTPQGGEVEARTRIALRNLI